MTIKKFFFIINFLLLLTTNQSFGQSFTIEQNQTGSSLNSLIGQSFTPSLKGSGTGNNNYPTSYLTKIGVIFSSSQIPDTLYILDKLPSNFADLASLNQTIVGKSISKNTDGIYTVYNYDFIKLNTASTYYAIFKSNCSMEFATSTSPGPYSGGSMLQNNGGITTFSGSDLKFKITFSLPAPKSISNLNYYFKFGSPFISWSTNDELNTISVVEKSINSDTSFKAITTTTSTIYAESGSFYVTGNRYFFRIKRTNESGISYSNIISFIYGELDQAPKVKVLPYSTTQNFIFANNQSEFTMDTLQIERMINGNFTLITKVASKSFYYDSDLNYGETYYYRFRGQNKYSFSGYVYDTIKTLDSTIGDWSIKGRIPDYRFSPVGFSIGNKGYMALGSWSLITQHNDIYEYDADNNVWTKKADFPGLGREKAVAFTIGTKAYVGLGRYIYQDGNDYKYNMLKDFYEFNSTENIWKKIKDYPGKGAVGASSFTIGNKGYVIGGDGISGSQNDVWEYDPSTENWIEKAPFLINGIVDATSFSINDKGYIGFGNSNLYYNTITGRSLWEYNPSDVSNGFDSNGNPKGLWTKKNTIPTDFLIDRDGYLINPVNFILQGNVYFALGGTKEFFLYNPVNNTFSSRKPFPGNMDREAISLNLGNRGYVLAGAGNGPIPEIWEFNPFSPIPYGLNALRVNNEITLNWKDNSNYETGFEIQRSLDNYSFTGIAIVSNNINQYTDTFNKNTTVYYRIRSIFGEEKSNFSNTVTVKYPTAVNTNISSYFSIMPNPAYDYFVINLNNDVGQKSCHLFNCVGDLVKVIEIHSNSTKVNVQDLNNGVYILKLGTNTIKLFINK